MGNSYPVPRSVKGESRILVIFTLRSFVTTVAVGLIGAGIWYLLDMIGIIGLVPGLVITAIFAGVGFAIGSLKIPDIPAMGKLRKAGGENVLDILIRFAMFKRKKKIYLYNINRGGK
ncbi:unknown [Clostridium sp. CAG:1219]|nr:unknown [Clostridium sp. CAG:1219]